MDLDRLVVVFVMRMAWVDGFNVGFDGAGVVLVNQIDDSPKMYYYYYYYIFFILLLLYYFKLHKYLTGSASFSLAGPS